MSSRTPKGAGIYPVSPQGRLLLGKRSGHVNNPRRWEGWGGSREPGETFKQCALRELFEEAGYAGPMWLYTIDPPNRFIGLVPFEFTPRLNWETEQAAWFVLHEVLNLHPKNWGLRKLVNNPTALDIITSVTE